jgi:uncharacterized protein (TIGR02996 family)
VRTFLYADPKSNKFWNITLDGPSFTVQFGRAGTAGQTQTKTFPDETKARKEYDKLVREKLAKGYHETTPVTAPSPRDALEAALLETPDDLATSMAYADYLEEQDDPRGEFVRVQLALESPGRTAAERKALEQREKKLLEDHHADWVGTWADLAAKTGPEGRGQHDFATPTFGFERGLLSTVTIDELTVECARAFVRSPQTRFVRRLYLGGFAYEEEFTPGPDLPRDIEEDPSRHVLFHWPYFANLRVFQLGWTSIEEYGDFCSHQCHLDGSEVHHLVGRMPRIEELYLFAHGVAGPELFSLKMPELRVVQLYHSDGYGLATLALNPTLGKLTHLLCHPHALEGEPAIRLPHLRAILSSPHLKSLTHLRLRLADFGDEGVAEIVRSGILKRLKMLDLRHGRITDEGARLFAGCPDARNFDLLDLSRNELTASGVNALHDAGVSANVDYQHGSTEGFAPGAYEAMQYLYEGDYE